MRKPEKLWDRAASNYDNTEEKFERIHRRSRENKEDTPGTGVSS